ncbi:MAG: hypothetical protein Q4Q25_00825, partial [Methanocorpusculum sp.]|nr:hypothetical protein [Methanocorpusculum sp.]
LCPAMWCNSENAYSGWTAFKIDVSTVLNKAQSVNDLAAPTGPGSYAATFMPGTVYVSKGDPVYLSPGGITIGFIPQDMSIEYTYTDSGYFYTRYGYVRSGR